MAAQMLMLVARKASGIDCTDDESAAIKRYFDGDRPDGEVLSPVAQDLAELFPLELAEWYDETEAGHRG